jgi:TolB-like protein
MATTTVLRDDKKTFGPYRLDLERRTLLRDGGFVALGGRAMDILCVLVAEGGNLVTKDELIARVWPGIVVEENNLHVQVSALRKALGEDSGGQRYVLTVSGRGYRFAAEPDERGGKAPDETDISEEHRRSGRTAEGSATVPPLPNKASIAVLPFQNMSGDPDQEYFADGIVEDIITALSRMRWLLVIARNSTFTYKGRAVDVKQVGRELGVRYALEGSVRKAANRLRITGQLIDTATGAHLWADRYDADIADVFELQDRLTSSVVGAMAMQLELAEIARIKHKPTTSLDAYDYYLRGLARIREWTRNAVDEALALFQKAIALDPDYASAYGMAARCYGIRKEHGWATDQASDVVEAERLARRAIELGWDDALALCTGGAALAYMLGEVETGITFLDRALALDPNLAMAWIGSGWARTRLGEPEIAIEHFARAIQLSPLDPLISNVRSGIAFAEFFCGRYDEASAGASLVLNARPNDGPALRIAAASHALAGRLSEARKAMERLRQMYPSLTISNLGKQSPLLRQEDRARWAEGMRRAGLPE